MSTYEVYKTSKGMEEEGTWVKMNDGSKWKLRRTNSKFAQKQLDLARKPHLSEIKRSERRNRDVNLDTQHEINMNWAAKGLVVDWEGVTDEKNEEMEFTVENVLKVFTDLPDLYLDVVTASAEVANFMEEEEEEDEGNLGMSSSTASKSADTVD